MMLFRNLLMTLGVLAIIVVALFLIRGDIADRFGFTGWAKQSAQPAPIQPGKVYVTLSANRADPVKDTEGASNERSAALDMPLEDLIEVKQEGLPPRNIPYLAVINYGVPHKISYYKLKKTVRKVTVRRTDVLNFKAKDDVVDNSEKRQPGVPYQVEIWVARDGDLNLIFEVGPPPAGSTS